MASLFRRGHFRQVAALDLERHDETSKNCTASNEKDGIPGDIFPIGEPNGLVQQVISLCRQSYAS
jgi:hypothetical protein